MGFGFIGAEFRANFSTLARITNFHEFFRGFSGYPEFPEISAHPADRSRPTEFGPRPRIGPEFPEISCKPLARTSSMMYQTPTGSKNS